MIDFVVVSSDLRSYVLDTRMKRGAELSADHHLVVSWIRWESARKTWQAQTWSEGELGTSGGGPCPGVLQLPPRDELLTHPEGGWGHGVRMDHVQSLYCGSGRQELWSEGRRCLSWRLSRRRLAVKEVRFGGLWIASLLFADDVVLLASSDHDLRHSMGRFAAECEAAGISQHLQI